MAVEPQTARALIHSVFDLQRTLRCVAHEHKSTNVGSAEAGVLRMISEVGGRAVHIAEKLSVSAPVLSRHVAELEERGLVARTPDPEDRRAQLLELTEAGKAKLAEIEEARTALLLDFLAGWDEEEAAACGDSIRRLTDTLRTAGHRAAAPLVHGRDPQKEEPLAAR
ncbi:MarR family transcriptional regulator [Sinomonas sp. ASV322]|uniref:MarR family winged helix-turn-helix transcriptional regulator n=1 Tax=Sinomonas sp. ASV322 TaxID=3041920 RepID=UPI0027DCC037|nr:MarR family transcriptional regulator [Sinomonas sp. ASV322]MDQ4503099.1 MarR family transcriptional regulator [Sinomonas sp. ASV322]